MWTGPSFRSDHGTGPGPGPGGRHPGDRSEVTNGNQVRPRASFDEGSC
jgi:hypothetical protein